MRTIEYRTAHVPAFLTKLWKLVTDIGSGDLISWNVNGTSFIIYDEIRFAKELLPMYFKHNNMASFVRQLNMYGFRKLSCIDQGGMHSSKHEIEFYHQYFIKDQESLLDLIKRKIPSNRGSDDPKVKPEYVKELISNIKNLQGKQQNAEEGMKHLRQENKLLWQQLSLLNGRYVKQQSMLQQVLPLFMNMMQSSRRIAIKRRQPLMIDEGEIKEKSRRVEPQYYVEHEDSNMSSPLTPSPGNVSNRGPLIHDVTEMESSKMFADNILCSPNTTKEHDVIVDSPLSSLESCDRTADSPYTDGDSMEPLNILNCNYQSIPSLTPPSSNIVPPVSLAAQPELLVRDMNMQQVNHQIQNLTSLPSGLHVPASTHHECSTSSMASATLNANSSCPQSLSGNPEQKAFPIDVLDESANQATLPPNDTMSRQAQEIENVLSWMPSGGCENDQNIDNWLGQLIRAENLVAGASLPDSVILGQNM